MIIIAVGLVMLLVVVLIDVRWKKANRTGALVAMAAGFVTWAIALVLEPGLPGDLMGLIACLVTLLLVTPLSQKFDPPRPVLNSDGEEVELKDRLGTLPLFRRAD